MPGVLGRRHALDPRDAGYRLSDLIAIPALETCRAWRYRNEAFNVDQEGDTCVANAATHFFGDGPIVHRLEALDAPYDGYRSRQSGQAGCRGYLYDQAQLMDEWSDTPPAGGTSVRAGFKAAQAMGWIREYRWLTGVRQVAACILEVSPVVIGVPWYESDMSLVSGDWIKGYGEVVGGHAVCLSGCNRTGIGKVRVQTWGLHAWMSFHVLARLLGGGDGEAAVGIEVGAP